jgi:hypothetical protein
MDELTKCLSKWHRDGGRALDALERNVVREELGIDVFDKQWRVFSQAEVVDELNRDRPPRGRSHSKKVARKRSEKTVRSTVYRMKKEADPLGCNWFDGFWSGRYYVTSWEGLQLVRRWLAAAKKAPRNRLRHERTGRRIAKSDLTRCAFRPRRTLIPMMADILGA